MWLSIFEVRFCAFFCFLNLQFTFASISFFHSRSSFCQKIPNRFINLLFFFVFPFNVCFYKIFRIYVFLNCIYQFFSLQIFFVFTTFQIDSPIFFVFCFSILTLNLKGFFACTFSYFKKSFKHLRDAFIRDVLCVRSLELDSSFQLFFFCFQFGCLILIFLLNLHFHHIRNF